ncbi:hypothetical protein CEP52_017101 [Fusarium oligoseptatum]|uniref:Nucleoside phosphorylase domain-containing protein n=1 Tax=Fusarium oligoseptatum TaxID=2604345 RepID=A0A428RWF3_9HYPO|nr:hypothetical protein CEP52_017101 [Fusarium oligoseptatum]
MVRSFPALKFCLLVGIAGGAPSEQNDIRLGDVVVGIPKGRSSGVVQYDLGKDKESNIFQMTGSLRGSGNSVIKNATRRDQLAREHGVLCFEMEAAGVVNAVSCLVIRGICDYCDVHKNDNWQNYAAATAAAYSKLLLGVVARKQGNAEEQRLNSVETHSSIPTYALMLYQVP